MDIFRTRVIAPIAISLMLSSVSAPAAVGHAGGFPTAMSAPHAGGQIGGGRHFGSAQSFGGAYYCTNPPGYYPYVASCGDPWQFVPPGAP